MYEFYRGMEVHPRLLGVDVKQWTNCRVGMMAWQILILAYLLAAARLSDYQTVNSGHFINVLVQTIYIAKFFWWDYLLHHQCRPSLQLFNSCVKLGDGLFQHVRHHAGSSRLLHLLGMSRLGTNLLYLLKLVSSGTFVDF